MNAGPTIPTLTVSLKEIWGVSDEELEQVLKTDGRFLSDHRNTDRALVAMIYYNAGQIDESEIDVVTSPQWLYYAARTADFKSLQESIVVPLLILAIEFEVVLNLVLRLAIEWSQTQVHKYIYDEAWPADSPNILDSAERARICNGMDAKLSPAKERKRQNWLSRSKTIIDEGAEFAGGLFDEMQSPDDERYPSVVDKAHNVIYPLAKALMTEPYGADEPSAKEIASQGMHQAWRVVLQMDIPTLLLPFHEDIREYYIHDMRGLVESWIDVNLGTMDLDIMSEMAQCYFTYMTGSLLEWTTADEEHLAKYQDDLKRCPALTRPEVDVATLSAPLAPVLGPIVQEYMGLPSREVVIPRLLNM